MAKYPGVIPTLNEIFKVTDYVDWIKSEEWSDLRAELRAALVELGTDPAGTFATVKDRLDDMLPHFHDRGDPADHDFGKEALTTDDTWRDLNLSSIVPAGTKAVALYVYILDDATWPSLRFRKNGNSNEKNASVISARIANDGNDADFIVPCDDSRVIEYRGSDTVFTDIFITVKGWWK